jgi:hypothetical protein
MAEVKKKIKYLPFFIAWIQYLGAFLTRLGNLGNVVRDSFSDIHAPKQDEYYF